MPKTGTARGGLGRPKGERLTGFVEGHVTALLHVKGRLSKQRTQHTDDSQGELPWGFYLMFKRFKTESCRIINIGDTNVGGARARTEEHLI